MKQKEFFDLAEEMERECGDWENSEGMSKEAYERLLARAGGMEKKSTVRLMKKRYLAVLAAALVLLMGMGAVGSRAWISDSSDIGRETEVTTKVDNEDKKDILLEEEEIYQEIGEKLGIAPMRLGYLPKGMKLDSYQIMESTGWAGVYYLYQEKVINVQMFKDSIEGSGNVQWDGEAYYLENVSNEFGYADCIEAYCIDRENQNYGASITYANGYYKISGSFKEEEFLEILNKIYFKNL